MTDFCIRQGGKMAGRSIEEAVAAQRAALNKTSRRPTDQQHSAHLATGTPTDTSITTSGTTAIPLNPTFSPPSFPSIPHSPVFIHGVPYYPNPFMSASIPTAHLASVASPYPPPAQSCPNPPLPEIRLNPGNLYEYHTFFATMCSDPPLPLNTFQPSRSCLSPYNLSDTPTASVDWSRFSGPQQAFSATTEPIPPHMIPFILDTGATCHISPVRSDFISLTPTPPRAVKGLGRTHVFVQGIGPV